MSMNDQPVRYAVLHDALQWDESVLFAGLEQAEGGALSLARLPGAADGKPVVLTTPSEPGLSGLAVGDCQELYLADTRQHRVIREDGLCHTQAVLPGAGGSGGALMGVVGISSRSTFSSASS